jgi:NADPH:quinone reductase-like Zn-dependent oxidoreductase
MTFGTIGAGTVALAFARKALATGHEVVLSGRRGPASLACKVAELGRGASAATVGEAASLDYVLLAVPWPNVEDALRGLPAWNGRVLIDATNPFIEYSPELVLADLGGKGASEVVAGLAPGARVVKAFNSVGGGVEHLKIGDRVLIPLYAFSWRERLVVPATGLFSLPEAEPQQLAMLGINPPTASLLLDEASDLKPGDWVVQNAANSGVGRSLIAIAKARGIKTINLVRRPELIPELQVVGGDLVVVDEDGALAKIRAAIGTGRVPLAIDGVAGKSSATIAGALSEHGIFVVYARMGGGPVVIDPLDLIVKRIVVKGFFLNHPDIEPKIHAALGKTIPLVASGAIRVPIAATYPLSSLREAVLHAQRGGKVLLDLRGTHRC